MFSLDGDPEYQKIAAGLKALQAARPVFPEGRVKAVARALEAALPDGPPPQPLLKPHYRREGVRAQELFGGRPRASLPAALLRENWAHTAYFTPQARAYYLPAFLTAALGPESRRDYLHSVLFMLAPDWFELYERPGEAHADDGALGAAGRAAVAGFLALAMDAPTALSWRTEATLPHGMAERELEGAALQYVRLAAQSARWRFAGAAPECDARAAAVYDSLAVADIPPPADPEAAALAGRIRAAFAETEAPPPDRMTGSTQGSEPYEYAVEFRGRDWRTLSAEFLSVNSAALSFLSDRALRYFLPAYLLHHLNGVSWNADPVFALTHGFGPDDKETDSTFDWEAVARRRFAVFDARERAAVADFLRFELGRGSAGDERVAAALREYWSKPA